MFDETCSTTSAMWWMRRSRVTLARWSREGPGSGRSTFIAHLAAHELAPDAIAETTG